MWNSVMISLLYDAEESRGCLPEFHLVEISGEYQNLFI